MGIENFSDDLREGCEAQYNNFGLLAADAMEAAAEENDGWEAVWPVTEDSKTWVKVRVEVRGDCPKPFIVVTGYEYVGEAVINRQFVKPFIGTAMVEAIECPFELELQARSVE